MKTTRMLVIIVLALGLAIEVANADFTFGTPTNLGPTVNSSYSDMGGNISTDGLMLFIESSRPPGTEAFWDMWATTRTSTENPWGAAVNLGPPVSTSHDDFAGYISADGLEFYFSSDRPGGSGGSDIWVTRRATRDAHWDPPVNLGPAVNTAAHEWCGSLSVDGLELYIDSTRSGGFGDHDLYVNRRPTRNDPWGAAVNLGPAVNSASSEIAPDISADGLCLFFSGNITGFRPVGIGGADIWVTTRTTQDDEWSIPTNLGATINTEAHDICPRVSSDGSWLYFSSTRPGGLGGYYGDIYQAPIIPIVDLNGDGIVDAADMCIMVDHWGENYSLCDIGPTPLGDGKVDVQDLIVLAEHLFEDVNDPTLVAHWALDETDGDIASDSANDNDGTVYGDPAWQPDGGMVYGALQLDGIDDYVNTPFVLNPADGKFSVFVWIKGGAPAQFVLSQMGGSNWLCTDSVEGNLMTELKAYGRGATGPLLSQTVITDGNWHRIGLVWDGSQRTLYVDDIAVAQDAQPDLEASENGLYIGAGTPMEPGSFWSGLIDDVRIYNRAVTP